jgi:hypothetical protein
MDDAPDSLLGRLRMLPEPRRRQGRRYPLAAMLGLLLLAALHGESSLRGMWLWTRTHWDELWWPLGFGSPDFPALTTLGNLLGALDADAIDRLVSSWLTEVLGQPIGGVSADGKVLRGSRRSDVPGVWLVALARQDLGSVVRQREVAPGSHELPTLLALLRETPLHDQVVTLDAGLLCAETTQVVRAQQANYLGVVKGNQAEIKTAVDDWIAEHVFSPSTRTTSGADDREIKGPPRDP